MDKSTILFILTCIFIGGAVGIIDAIMGWSTDSALIYALVILIYLDMVKLNKPKYQD